MTQETRCPACGAPLVFSGNNDVVRCSFCGAELRISEEDGQAHFRVLDQPEPQKEVLSQPTGAPQWLNELSGETGNEASQNIPPVQPAYPAPVATYTPVEERRNTNRWVVIAFTVLMGVVLTCACLVFVFAAVLRAR